MLAENHLLIWTDTTIDLVNVELVLLALKVFLFFVTSCLLTMLTNTNLLKRNPIY